MREELPGDFEERWRARFEQRGRTFSSDAMIAGWSDSGLATRVRAFRRRMGPVAGTWLDAGCGAGTYTRLLRAAGAREVVGLDYSVPSVLKARALRTEPGLMWAAGDVRALPFADGSFDGVICFGVTQALSDSSALLEELVRVVRPGGEVWVDGLNRKCIIHWAEVIRDRLRGRSPHLRLEDAGNLERRLERLGCQQIRADWVPIFPARLRGLQRLSEGLRLWRWPVLGAALSHAFTVRAVKSEK